MFHVVVSRISKISKPWSWSRSFANFVNEKFVVSLHQIIKWSDCIAAVQIIPDCLPGGCHWKFFVARTNKFREIVEMGDLVVVVGKLHRLLREKNGKGFSNIVSKLKEWQNLSLKVCFMEFSNLRKVSAHPVTRIAFETTFFWIQPADFFAGQTNGRNESTRISSNRWSSFRSFLLQQVQGNRIHCSVGKTLCCCNKEQAGTPQRLFLLRERKSDSPGARTKS